MESRNHDRANRPRRGVRGSAAAGALVLLAFGCRSPPDPTHSVDPVPILRPGPLARPAPGEGVVAAPGSAAEGMVSGPGSAADEARWSAHLAWPGAKASSQLGQSAATGGLPPLVAALEVDPSDGDFPRRVGFDATASELGAGDVIYEWSFGDGSLTHDGPTTVHTYVGAGEFVATLTLVDGTGQRSAAQVTLDLSTPGCPDDAPPLTLGDLDDDDDLSEISGIAASRLEPGAFWVHEDVDVHQLFAVDLSGEPLSEHELPVPLVDVEDMAAVVDPATGTPLLFIGDIGDNDLERAEVVLWILEEPDPLVDGVEEPIAVRLTYPFGPVNAESLLVDPFTLDVFVVTKNSDVTEVFVKRAPHAEGGPFELEALGSFDSLDFTATGGDVSADGLRVVVRGYGDTAVVWARDGYRPLEEVFEEEPCELDIPDEDQGEAVTFTIDGRGVVTTSEGEGAPVYFIGL